MKNLLLYWKMLKRQYLLISLFIVISGVSIFSYYFCKNNFTYFIKMDMQLLVFLLGILNIYWIQKDFFYGRFQFLKQLQGNCLIFVLGKLVILIPSEIFVLGWFILLEKRWNSHIIGLLLEFIMLILFFSMLIAFIFYHRREGMAAYILIIILGSLCNKYVKGMFMPLDVNNGILFRRIKGMGYFDNMVLVIPIIYLVILILTNYKKKKNK